MAETMETGYLKRKLDRGDDFVLIEVLAEKPYRRGHIKGAINIPFRQIGREASERFDRDREIVVYCADRACKASTIAAEKLDSLGFENVFHYAGGKKEWMEAGYPME
jgi:rhodanese-related sulfurtransferase